jgi:RNA polymerase sigma factor (sigma-70 family)
MVSHLRTLAAHELADQQLLAQFGSCGDDDAFAEIVHRHGKLVHGVCRRLLGPGPDIDDAFQATFVVLARKAASIRKQGALASWLYGVAYRVASELRKQRIRRRQYEAATTTALTEIPEHRDMYVDPASRAALQEVGAIIVEELQHLSDTDRQALVTCLMQGMSHSEAASHLGWPLGTLKTRMERGRQTLRRRLEHRGLALSAMALGVVLAEQTAGAMPPDLVPTTLEAVAHHSCSARVAALAQTVLRSLAAGKIRLAGLGLLTACLIGLGATAAALTMGGDPPAVIPPIAAEPEKPAPDADALDGPLPVARNLPAGAIASFGAVPFHHGARVATSELSPDGTRLATLGRRSATLWEMATGQVLRSFFFDIPALPTWADGLAFSPDGKWLACRPTRDRILVWDLASGKEVRRFTIKPAWYSHAFLCFSADGRALIAQTDQDVAWLNIATGAVDRRLPQVRIKQLSPDDKTFAMVDEEKRLVHMGDAATGRIVHSLPIAAKADAMEQGILFLPDRVTVAIVHHADNPPKEYRHEVQFWDYTTSQRQPRTWAIPESDRREAYRLALSHDGKVLFFPEDRKNIRRYSLESGQELPPLDLYGQWTSALFPHPDGKMLVSVHPDAIRRWDIANQRQISRDEDFVDWRQTAISPDGRWLAMGAYQAPFRGILEVRDVETGKGQRIEYKGSHQTLAFTPDSKALAVNHYEHIQFLKVPELTEIKKLKPDSPAAGEGSMVFSPDGRFLAATTTTARFRLVDLATGKEIFALDEIANVAFSPDSSRMLVVSRNSPMLRSYETTTRKLQYEVELPPDRGSLRRHWARVAALAVAPDGRRVAMAMTGGNVCLVDTASGKERTRFVSVPTEQAMGRDGDSYLHATALAFSPGGQWLAAGGEDGFLRIWEVSTRRELHRLHGHEGPAEALAFSADGRRLLSFGSGEAILWDLRPRRDTNKSDPLADLLSDSGPKVYRAMWALAASPAAPAMLRAKFAPRHLDARPERVAKLVTDLDSPLFEVRDAAHRGLAELEAGARPALVEALEKKPSLETSRRLQTLLEAIDGQPSPRDLQILRAVHAMELQGSTPAQQLLREWSEGTPGLRLTDEARAALTRLRP